MSTAATNHTHIACESVGGCEADVVVVELGGDQLAGPDQARELRERFDALLEPGLPHRFVIDFGNIASIDDVVFGEIVSFARRASRVVLCNVEGNLRLDAAMTDLDLYAAFAPNREAAVDEARRGELRGQEETVDYPAGEPGNGERACDIPSSVPKEASPSSSKVVAAAKAADERARAGGDMKEDAPKSLPRAVAIAAGLTVEEFGGRSDAPGG